MHVCAVFTSAVGGCSVPSDCRPTDLPLSSGGVCVSSHLLQSACICAAEDVWNNVCESFALMLLSGSALPLLLFLAVFPRAVTMRK